MESKLWRNAGPSNFSCRRQSWKVTKCDSNIFCLTVSLRTVRLILVLCWAVFHLHAVDILYYCEQIWVRRRLSMQTTLSVRCKLWGCSSTGRANILFSRNRSQQLYRVMLGFFISWYLRTVSVLWWTVRNCRFNYIKFYTFSRQNSKTLHIASHFTTDWISRWGSGTW